MSDPVAVPLRRVETGDFVNATIWPSVDEGFAAKADDTWLTFLAALRAERLARGLDTPAMEHEHWRWREKLAETKSLLAYLTMGVECDGKPQGMMMLVTDGHFSRLSSKTAIPLVYVEFLAAAPWNLRTVVDRPKYAGVGSVLMRAAIATSMDLEFKGRLALHALPQAEGYYEAIGMVGLGPDAKKHNLKYYEFTSDGAQAFIG